MVIWMRKCQFKLNVLKTILLHGNEQTQFEEEPGPKEFLSLQTWSIFFFYFSHSQIFLEWIHLKTIRCWQRKDWRSLFLSFLFNNNVGIVPWFWLRVEPLRINRRKWIDIGADSLLEINPEPAGSFLFLIYEIWSSASVTKKKEKRLRPRDVPTRRVCPPGDLCHISGWKMESGWLAAEPDASPPQAEFIFQ